MFNNQSSVLVRGRWGPRDYLVPTLVALRSKTRLHCKLPDLARRRLAVPVRSWVRDLHVSIRSARTYINTEHARPRTNLLRSHRGVLSTPGHSKRREAAGCQAWRAGWDKRPNETSDFRCQAHMCSIASVTHHLRLRANRWHCPDGRRSRGSCAKV